MKYYVTYMVTSKYVAEVDAENVEEALKKAKAKQLEEDFGPLEDIQSKMIYVEDGSGEFWHNSELINQKLKADIVRKH